MKNRIFLLLILSIIIPSKLTGANGLSNAIRNQPFQNNKKLVFVLKDKKGNLLENVYIEDFKGEVFRKLLILKEGKGKPDTLYFINGVVFKNPKGVDITFAKDTFAGYKIESHKEDSFSMFGIGKENSGASDPAMIEWNYKKKLFEVWQAQ